MTHFTCLIEQKFSAGRYRILEARYSIDYFFVIVTHVCYSICRTYDDDN
jgi:hypothetical protein